MKTINTLLIILCVLPAALCAQPTITNNEFYHIGDMIKMVSCDATSAHAGAAGAAVTWDFSTLNPSGGFPTTYIEKDNSSIFITSNILEILPNGQKVHMQENSTDSYINGIEDTVHGITYNYYSNDIAKRPITYNTQYIDSYRVVISTPATVGTGHRSQTCDGYGTLILPIGTFNNVLRLREVLTETDTQTVPDVVYTGTTTVSYLWFDGVHSAPLLRFDSVNSALTNSNTVMFNAEPEVVATVNGGAAGFSGYFDNSGLQINGDFEYGKVYDVVLYNIIGSKVFSEEFVASGNARHFDVGGQVRDGIYIVSIMQKDNPESRSLFKLVKQ